MEQVTSETWDGVGTGGLINSFQYVNGVIRVDARWACFVRREMAPSQLYVFDAKQFMVGDVNINTPASYSPDSRWSEMTAYYYPCENTETFLSDNGVIIYYLDQLDSCAVSEWADEERDSLSCFANCFAVLELHELTHWAVPHEDNETDPDHWERWNEVLRGVVGYVAETGTWRVKEYEVEETENGLRTTVGDFVSVDTLTNTVNESKQVGIDMFSTQE